MCVCVCVCVCAGGPGRPHVRRVLMRRRVDHHYAENDMRSVALFLSLQAAAMSPYLRAFGCARVRVVCVRPYA
jgi:hypothetical protein